MEKIGTIAIVHPLVKPIDAKVSVPGSKSFTNRALIVAALANGVTRLHGASDSNDSSILIKLLDRLGVGIIEHDGIIEVHGNGGKFEEFNGMLNVEDAGTVMRFLTAMCCLVPGEVTIGGTDRMNKRPIKELVNALRHLGAEISCVENEGYPPIKISGGTLKGGTVRMNGGVSSQFISALLMIAPLLEKDTEIHIEGEQVSEPYIDMTTSVMNEFGIEVNREDKYYMVNGNSEYKACEYNVEGDASSASYMFALAALCKSKVEVLNVPGKSLQGDIKFADVLEEMGCKIAKSKNSITVTGTDELNALKVNMQNMPDVAQTLAVLVAFAKGETVIKGLKTLQHKESKRITALQNELTKMGVNCSVGDDFIKIKGGNPKGVSINTYNDHRMAMAFAIAGVKLEGMSIKFPGVVKKSFPTFWDTLKIVGVNVELE